MLVQIVLQNVCRENCELRVENINLERVLMRVTVAGNNKHFGLDWIISNLLDLSLIIIKMMLCWQKHSQILN